MSAAKEPATRLVVHAASEARQLLPRSITLASSSLSPVAFQKEFKSGGRHRTPSPMEHAVDQNAEDRVRKDVAVPEPCRLASNALFDDRGVPLIPLLRSHLYKEGLFSPLHSPAAPLPHTSFSFFTCRHAGRLTTECALELITRAKAVLKEEPNVVVVRPPSIGLCIFAVFFLSVPPLFA